MLKTPAYAAASATTPLGNRLKWYCNSCVAVYCEPPNGREMHTRRPQVEFMTSTIKKAAQRRHVSTKITPLLAAVMTRAAYLISLVQGFLTRRSHRFSAGFNGVARNVDNLSKASIAFFNLLGHEFLALRYDTIDVFRVFVGKANVVVNCRPQASSEGLGSSNLCHVVLYKLQLLARAFFDEVNDFARIGKT